MRTTQFVGYRLPSSQYHGRVRGDYRQYKPINIRPEFLPKGWRFLRPDEEIEQTDFFWSEQNKIYLPVTQKFALQDRAGHTIPFIRRIANEKR